jgi:hypothetical protein
VVGERAVELEVERHDLERQLCEPGGVTEHRRHGEPTHAVARVDDDLQRSDAAEVDERTQVGRVVGQYVDLGDRAGGDARRIGIGDALLEVIGRTVADRREARVERDALRPCA